MLQRQLIQVVGYLPSNTISSLSNVQWEEWIPVPGEGWIKYFPGIKVQKEHLLSCPYELGGKTAPWEIILHSESAKNPYKLFGYFREALSPYEINTAFSPLPIVHFFNFPLFSEAYVKKVACEKIKMERHLVEISVY